MVLTSYFHKLFDEFSIHFKLNQIRAYLKINKTNVLLPYRWVALISNCFFNTWRSIEWYTQQLYNRATNTNPYKLKSTLITPSLRKYISCHLGHHWNTIWFLYIGQDLPTLDTNTFFEIVLWNLKINDVLLFIVGSPDRLNLNSSIKITLDYCWITSNLNVLSSIILSLILINIFIIIYLNNFFKYKRLKKFSFV